jgi:hypothetical protein
LTAVPAAAFILPDLFGGHLLMAGDNVQQNYPLHVLVGSMWRRGELPFWNQYIFSGSPLLAGFNAGALYPLVALFVVLPDRVAWIATEVILYSGIAIGMYVFLRALKLSTVACVVAAATFAFSGTVLSQVNHVDMTEGFLAIPWMLLAVLRIVNDGRWRWAVLLGVAFATVIFGGAPEAMLDEALLVMAYAALSCGLDRSRWWRVLTRGATAAALGLSLSALQWLPGLNFIANSQRSGFGSSFAATGSFPPPFGVLSLVPYLLGGYGHLGETAFFSHYNLPEVGLYLGILPLIALLTLLWPRWPSRLAGAERRTWYLVGLFGLLLALGANTPLEHLFNSLPLYGQQRLQSRNMIDVSVAVCVLFAGWLDRAAAAPGRRVVHLDRVLAAVPLALTVGLAVWAWADPASLLRVFGEVTSASHQEVHTVREATIFAVSFCAGAAVVVWLRPSLPLRWWLSLVTLFVAADLGLVAWTGELASFPSNDVLSGKTAIGTVIAANLQSPGRFALYDPQGYAIGTVHQLAQIPDLNILSLLPSVGGYASVVNGNYGAVTDTHKPGELNIPQLGSGALDDLDLQEMVTLPEYFLLPLASSPRSLAGVQPQLEHHGADPVLPMGSSPNEHDPNYQFYPSPRAPLGDGGTSTWFLGETLHPQTATLLFAGGATAAVVRFGVAGAGRSTSWSDPVPVPAGATSVTSALPSGPATSLAVQVVSGRIPSFQSAISADNRNFELAGALSSALRPGPWRLVQVVAGFTLLVRTQPPRPIHVLSHGTGPAPSVHIVSSFTKSETVHVQAARAVTVIRDVSWDPGWEGSVRVNGGPARAVPVTAYGLVQQMAVPPGDDVVTFSYRPPHLLVASALSLGAVLVLLAVGLGLVVRRRRRSGGQRAGPDGGASPEGL